MDIINIEEVILRIPEKGMKGDEIFEQLHAYQKMDVDWRSGRVLGYIYDAGREAEDIGKKAYMMFLSESGLDPTTFPSLMEMENDLVSMMASHAGGDDRVVGNFTSGGTESILLAVKTARDCSRKTRPGVTRPEMVLPVTAHAAFHKAAEYFDVRVVQTPVDSRTYKADPGAMEAAVTPDTILLVASAPSYAHGVIDPIPEIGGLAQERDLFFHVDACVGGFMLPFLRELGEPVPEFGFKVPGVTSVSMDFHKYGYTPKNASVILYKNRSIRRHQLFACSAWPGYSLANNTIQSSKSGGPLAAAWAVVHFLGTEGYREFAKQTRQATLKLVEGINRIKGLQVLGQPDMFMFSVASESVNVFHVVDQMKKRGWYLQPQLSYDNSPENFHISLTIANVHLIDDLLENLRESVDEARKQKSGDIVMIVKDALADIQDNSINEDNIARMMAMAGIKTGGVPGGDMGDINEILNALSPELRELLLKEFLNELFVTRSGD
jgi:glutamate/tyrosine decarboxylase-like PLP-dependent enzyme